MKPKNHKQLILFKLVALFTVIRGYNIAVLILAMYSTAYFIFENNIILFEYFKNINLHLIIFASAFTISGGYIINNFYDIGKDTISKPLTTYISRFISQNFKLTVYLSLSFISLILAFLVSWHVGLFFILYNFMVWFYSHKLSKIMLIHNLFYVVLSIMPFIALLLFYNNYSTIIFYHGLFLSLILLLMDLVKDLKNYKADLIYNYQTLPVTIGIKKSKQAISIVTIILFSWTIYMSTLNEVGHMRIYFFTTAFLILLTLFLLWNFKFKWQYNLIYLLLKVMLGFGVLSIAWIKINPLDLQKLFTIN